MDWCVLRTASRHTIPLAESLSADGYEVWTPIETRLVRIPRKHEKRELKLPIMPSYVFARSERLMDLLTLEAMPVKPRREGGAHAQFTVMRMFSEIPLIPSAHLANLRDIEERLAIKALPRKQFVQAFIAGEMLRMGGGILGGMVGRVLRSNEGSTILSFGTRQVKISTSFLRQKGICEPDSAVL